MTWSSVMFFEDRMMNDCSCHELTLLDPLSCLACPALYSQPQSLKDTNAKEVEFKRSWSLSVLVTCFFVNRTLKTD